MAFTLFTADVLDANDIVIALEDQADSIDNGDDFGLWIVPSPEDRVSYLVMNRKQRDNLLNSRSEAPAWMVSYTAYAAREDRSSESFETTAARLWDDVMAADLLSE